VHKIKLATLTWPWRLTLAAIVIFSHANSGFDSTWWDFNALLRLTFVMSNWQHQLAGFNNNCVCVKSLDTQPVQVRCKYHLFTGLVTYALLILADHSPRGLLVLLQCHLHLASLFDNVVVTRQFTTDTRTYTSNITVTDFMYNG